MFQVTGSGFIHNVEVTLRGARIGPDGVFNDYWMTRSSPDGTISIDLPIPYVTGLNLSFRRTTAVPIPTT